MKKRKEEVKLLMFLLPSFLGLLFFFVIPFALSFYYSLIDNPITSTFVGLKNYIDIVKNANFNLALKNTAIFILLCVPLNMIIPLFFALLLNRMTATKNILGLIFLLPLVIPSSAIVFFWKNIFGLNGALNLLYYLENPVNWIQSSYSIVIIIAVFLWKNAGYNIVLFMAGLNFIPKDYYEYASIEGAGAFWKFTRVTLVYLTPTAFLVFVMSFVNSFKSFREIYLLAGNYPHESIYMLQHYMNNQFAALNYQKLVSAAYILFVFITILVGALFYRQHKHSDSF